ncbi:MAG: hypothetical protein K2N87_11100 [Eubacterium sp.]|nr:hypothetical protein [Eubacterium sp.]
MTRDCWDDFALSGRVSDYLKYREQEQRGGQQRCTAAWAGGKTHGTYDRPDGHGACGNAGR